MCELVYDISDMTIQYCESHVCEILLFRVVEVQRTCEATATPSYWTEGANLSELLFAYGHIVWNSSNNKRI